ncbi:MAG TPA: hypothetical protein VGM53_31830 [Streptosporangiaceae bacterium]|jgi:hypothetical protein
MTPAQNTRIWRKTRRQASRGIPTGRRAAHHARAAYGRHQQDQQPEGVQAARERARLAWLTAPKETELDRWNDLYDLVVPRPRPAERSAA